jgi:hypothetical protein
MPPPTEDRPAPPAPRFRRFLTNPIGWLLFLILEAAVLFGLIRVLPLEQLASGVALPMELVLVIAVVIVNYRIRRIYLSDWWDASKG